MTDWPEPDDPRQRGSDAAADKAFKDTEFSLFYTEDIPCLVGFLVVQGARANTAFDIAQDAMTEAYRRWDHLDSPRAWVRTVASRKWWNSARRDAAEVLSDEIPEPSQTLSSKTAEEIENRHTLLALLRTLPPFQRQVMAWTYDGYRPTEIAAVLGREPTAVRSALRDARAALRKRHEP